MPVVSFFSLLRWKCHTDFPQLSGLSLAARSITGAGSGLRNWSKDHRSCATWWTINPSSVGHDNGSVKNWQ